MAVSPYVRVIGSISGLLAVGLGTIGAHSSRVSPTDKQPFQIANTYHLIHTVAILIAPTNTIAAFFTAGCILFSGTTYTRILLPPSNPWKEKIRKLTPYGGTCFLLGWGVFAFTA